MENVWVFKLIFYPINLSIILFINRDYFFLICVSTANTVITYVLESSDHSKKKKKNC